VSRPVDADLVARFVLRETTDAEAAEVTRLVAEDPLWKAELQAQALLDVHMHEAFDALRARGVEDPAAHTVVWEVWHNCKASVFERDPERCPQKSRFTFVMIKRTPVSAADVANLREWEKMLADRGPDDRGFARGLVWQWLPGEGERSVWAVRDVDQLEQLRDVASTHGNRERQHPTGADEANRGAVDNVPSFAGNPHRSPRIVAKVEI